MDEPHVGNTQDMCFTTTNSRIKNNITNYTPHRKEIQQIIISRNIGSHLSLKT